MKNFKFMDWLGIICLACIVTGSIFDDRMIKGISYCAGSLGLLVYTIDTLLWTRKMSKQLKRDIKEFEEWERSKK